MPERLYRRPSVVNDARRAARLRADHPDDPLPHRLSKTLPGHAERMEEMAARVREGLAGEPDEADDAFAGALGRVKAALRAVRSAGMTLQEVARQTGLPMGEARAALRWLKAGGRATSWDTLDGKLWRQSQKKVEDEVVESDHEQKQAS